MTVTKESEGRLNVFAKEPEIRVIQSKPSINLRSQLLIIVAAIILISIFGAYLINK